jgi:hypothetical protein
VRASLARWSHSIWTSPTFSSLHAKGYITDPVGKAKQVLVTEEGARESERLLQALFGSKPD